ncbi:MAG TPA: thioredoxin-like domain-containing protein [Opitutaceae bacterium]|nr:thioredoxin-like domain-containing protein [Opitutaceae bacterium]
MKPSRLLVLFALFATAALAQELTLADLARRPELLPAQATLKQPVKLQGRPALPVGQKLTVVSVRGTTVELETPDGRSLFTTKADDTDVLTTAQEMWKKLTPEQRALTLAALLQRKELWTYRVTLKQPVRLDTGEIKPGEQAILVNVEGNDLLLAYEKGNFLFNVAPAGTDFLDSARKLLVDKNAFPGRVAEDLRGKLISPATGAAAPLEGKTEPSYFAFYRGASWCGPCRQFSPSLVKFYKDMKAKHPAAFEIIYISGDKTPAEMKGYAKEAGFAWSTVPQNLQPQMQIVNRLFTNLIPQLVVTDRQGNVVIDSARIGGEAALKQFAAILNKG